MSQYLTGTFAEKSEVIQAIRQLKTDGYTADDLALFSDEPVELPRGILDRPSNMSFVVVSGAVLFLLSVIGFVYFAQNDYKLKTGGMPIFSFWPTGVVFYEITMLGSILTTTAWFIWESGLFRRDKSVPVPAIEPEVICLRVRHSAEKFAAASEVLTKAGAKNVVKLENQA